MTIVASIAVFFLGAVALRLAWPASAGASYLESVGGGGIQQDEEAEEPMGFRASQTPRV